MGNVSIVSLDKVTDGRAKATELVKAYWTWESGDWFISELNENDPPHRWFAAVDKSGILLGVAGVYIDNWNPYILGLTWVLVHGEHRNKGIATKLLNATLKWAKRHDFEVVQLTTPIPSFYDRFGFVKTGTVAGYDLLQKQIT